MQEQHPELNFGQGNIRPIIPKTRNALAAIARSRAISEDAFLIRNPFVYQQSLSYSGCAV